MRLNRPVRRGRISLGNGVGLGMQPLASGTPFTPLSLSPALWLKADAGLYQETSSPSTLSSADGDPVGTWQDQSGNARHASAPTSAKRSTLKLAIQNGMPAILWDEVDDQLLTSAFQAWPSKRGSLFVVFKQTFSVPATNCHFISTYPGGAWFSWSMATNPVGAGTRYKYYDSNAWKIQTNAESANFMSQALIRTGDTTLLFRRNGSLADTFTIDTNQPANTVLSIGNSTDSTAPFGGYIGEILLFDTVISGTDLTNVEAYLNARWNIY